MMATLTTQTTAFAMSSALQDLVWSTAETELHIRISFQQTVSNPVYCLIDTTLAAVNGQVKLYETRELVERYMRLKGMARMYPLNIQHIEGSAWHTDAVMTVIFCEKNIVTDDLSQWLEEHFLSTITAKNLPTDENTVEQLFFVQPQGTPPNPSLHVSYIDDSGAVEAEDVEMLANYNPSLTNLFVCEFSLAAIKEAVTAASSIIAVTVSVGNRHMEYYRPARKENVAFRFLNAFNVFESAYLSAVVARKTEDGRKIARLAGGLAHYDRRPVTEYEVQTAPLSFEEASWIDQLVTSPDVRLLDDTPLIIVDGEALCANDNAEMNSAKFTYKERDERHSMAFSPQANIFTVPPHSYQFS